MFSTYSSAFEHGLWRVLIACECFSEAGLYANSTAKKEPAAQKAKSRPLPYNRNVELIYNGVEYDSLHSLVIANQRNNVPYRLIRTRIRCLGWDFDRAMNEPAKARSN